MTNRNTNSLITVALLSGCLLILFIRYGLGLNPGCPFKAVTGIPCPGCGGMRSLDALLHGELLDALWINPLSMLTIVGIGASILWLGIDILRHTDSFMRFIRRFNNKKVLYILLFLLTANWIWNITKDL